MKLLALLSFNDKIVFEANFITLNVNPVSRIELHLSDYPTQLNHLIVFLDPRTVVYDESGNIIYAPNPSSRGFDPTVWLGHCIRMVKIPHETINHSMDEEGII